MEKTRKLSLTRIARWAGFLILCAGLTGEVCLEERGVDIVVGANIIAAFQARGEQNVYFDTEVVDLVDNADIDGALEENGFEDKGLGRIQSIFYRITKPDVGAPNRTVSGSVTADGHNLIDYTSLSVNDPALAEWTPASPDIIRQDGIDYLNGLLESYFQAIFDETPPPITEVTFQVSGTSTPQAVPTDFNWEVRVTVVLVGKTVVDVVDPL